MTDKKYIEIGRAIAYAFHCTKGAYLCMYVCKCMVMHIHMYSSILIYTHTNICIFFFSSHLRVLLCMYV